MDRRIVSTTAATILALAVAACGDDANVIGPANQPEIANVTDSFEWQVSGLSNVSQSLVYTWANTGVTADVDQASSLEAGTVTLRISDGEGEEVYVGILDEDGTFRTRTGEAGDWTVVVTLSEATGSASFRLENPDASP